MLEISSEDVLQRIRTENPWWSGDRGTGALYGDLKPRAYFDLFLQLLTHSSVRRAVVLLGPRRVGKTVMIHQAVQALIRENVPATSLGYFSVDNPIFSGLGIEQLLDFFGQASGTDYKTAPCHIFLDEIQYLRNWEVHLKSAVDTYPNIKFAVSGSAAAALKLKSEESGAGRFTDFLLPPLTFYEYLSLLGKTNLIQEVTNNPGGNERPTAFFATSEIEETNRQFLNYLNFGGYPEVIFSPEIQANPARFIKSDIIDKVLLRDLPSLYGISDIQELNHLFTTLAFNTATEVSLEELSQNSGVVKNTIKRYIEYLEAAFLIKVVHRVDHSAKRFRRANFFKVYLTNPSMRAALFAPLKPDDRAMGSLTETGIFSQWFHRQTALYYARWQRGEGEVDMVHLGPDQKVRGAVEVKWSDRYCETQGLNELRNLISFCKKNHLADVLVTTKTKTKMEIVDGVTVSFLPASIYCYIVGYHTVRNRHMDILIGLSAPSRPVARPSL